MYIKHQTLEKDILAVEGTKHLKVPSSHRMLNHEIDAKWKSVAVLFFGLRMQTDNRPHNILVD